MREMRCSQADKIHFLLDHTRHEIGVTLHILIHAGCFESRQIGLALLDSDNRPGISAGREHGIHQEPRDAPVAVRVGMDVAE